MSVVWISDEISWWGFGLSNPSAPLTVPANCSLLIGSFHCRGNTSAQWTRMDFDGVAMTDIYSRAAAPAALSYVENPVTGSQTIDAHITAGDDQGTLGAMDLHSHKQTDPIADFGAHAVSTAVPVQAATVGDVVVGYGWSSVDSDQIVAAGDMTLASRWTGTSAGAHGYKLNPSAGETTSVDFTNNDWGIIGASVQPGPSGTQAVWMMLQRHDVGGALQDFINEYLRGWLSPQEILRRRRVGRKQWNTLAMPLPAWGLDRP